ncbi:hypothetical protein JG687_00003001 [Phytophthora cactorum]|uniref:Fibronectin type-III domain-containing protein n=1 Tax=Phytophthora cactorum TaxID=29920 RepID=A0A8T1UXL2_9STRA|nr:hypothetical protein JG687_00003001 [Phytophthora cactorum]
MALMWDAVQDMGGDEHVQYEVTFFKCSSAGVQEEDPQMKRTDSTKVVIEDLQYSSFYSVNVVAITSTSLVGDVSSSLLVETEQPFEGVIVAASSEMTVKENAGVVSVPITRVNGSFGNVSYSFDVVDGSASSGVNYVRATGTRTLTTNVVSDSVDITVISDSVYNPGISFQVIITDSNTALPSTTDVRLEDDGDAGFISFADPALMVLENSGMAYLTITRTGGRRPRSVLQTFVSSNNSVINRFQLLDSTVVFEEDVAQQTISVSITDDSEFQYVADSVTIGFKILEGGVLNGTYTTATLTALDDGDISFPKQCLNLQKTSVTGGSLGLQWTPPVDRGGADILLSYLVSIAVGTEIIIKKESPTEAITLYGLNQSTTYQVSVQAVNYAGAGVSSTSLLIATRPATAPTAPRNIQVLSASSSSVLIQWDSPLDDGGSAIVAYKIYKVSGATTSTRSLYPSVSCSTPTVCTIKQLLALTSYNIQVQASTAFVTQGEYSEVVTLTTSSPVYPDMPPIAAVTWASAGAMTIGMFDPVNIGGANIQEYRLFMRADDEVEFASVFSGASAEHTVYRLRYQTVYYIKYQVVNSVGPSAYSPIVSNQTLSKSLPSAPTDVSVIDKTGGAITLAWNEPLDVGGREVTGYTVKIVSIGGNSANVVGYDGKGVPLLFWVIIFMKRTRGVRDTLLLIQDPSQESLKQRLLLKMRLDIIDHGQVVDEEKIQLFETEMLAHFLCDKNLNEPSTVAQVGFIYHSYSTHFWWFEVWDLGRKLLLNCIISLLAKAGANRVICGLVVLLVYLSVMLFYQPYREPSDSALAGLVHIQLFITLFCGLILKMGLLYLEERVVRLVTNAAIITNMMTLCYAVVSILNEKRNALKMVQRQTREDHRRAIAAHARKLWRKAFGYALTEVYLDNPNAGPMPLLVMTELARRRRYERDLDELNAQLELTSAVNPPPAARDQQDAMVSASQINVLEDEDDEPDENLNDPFETNSDLADNEQNVMASTS